MNTPQLKDFIDSNIKSHEEIANAHLKILLHARENLECGQKLVHVETQLDRLARFIGLRETECVSLVSETIGSIEKLRIQRKRDAAKIEELETTLGHMRKEENNDVADLRSANVCGGSLRAGSAEPPLKNPSGPVPDYSATVVPDKQPLKDLLAAEENHLLDAKEVRDFFIGMRDAVLAKPLNIIPASHVENNPLGGLMPKVGSKWKSNLNGHEFEVIYSSDIVILFYHDDDLCYHLKSIPDKVFAEMKPVK